MYLNNFTGRKDDSGKPRMDLLINGCPSALLSVGEVLTKGAEKYSDHNWKKVPNSQERYTAALMRHLLAVSTGEINDPETGLPHLAHVACNALFILEIQNGTKTVPKNI